MVRHARIEKWEKRAFPPLPTRPQLMAVYPALLNSERFLHYCSCQIVRDWIALYPALFLFNPMPISKNKPTKTSNDAFRRFFEDFQNGRGFSFVQTFAFSFARYGLLRLGLRAHILHNVGATCQGPHDKGSGLLVSKGTITTGYNCANR